MCPQFLIIWKHSCCCSTQCNHNTTWRSVPFIAMFYIFELENWCYLSKLLHWLLHLGLNPAHNLVHQPKEVCLPHQYYLSEKFKRRYTTKNREIIFDLTCIVEPSLAVTTSPGLHAVELGMFSHNGIKPEMLQYLNPTKYVNAN